MISLGIPCSLTICCMKSVVNCRASKSFLHDIKWLILVRWWYRKRTTTSSINPPIHYLNNQDFSIFLHRESCLINHFNLFHQFSDQNSHFYTLLGTILYFYPYFYPWILTSSPLSVKFWSSCSEMLTEYSWSYSGYPVKFSAKFLSFYPLCCHLFLIFPCLFWFSLVVYLLPCCFWLLCQLLSPFLIYKPFPHYYFTLPHFTLCLPTPLTRW